jgi:hypothetical protein
MGKPTKRQLLILKPSKKTIKLVDVWMNGYNKN